jgi:hypothetical protein
MKILILLGSCLHAIRISELPYWVKIPPLVEKSESTNFILLPDQNSILPCKASANPSPKITWYKDGGEITENEDFTILDDGSLKITSQCKL